MSQLEYNLKLRRLKHQIDSFCGLYTRVARRLGLDRTYVSKVAKGERHSPAVEVALIREFDRAEETAPN
jgi:transcriptional regulator with XRE-family HTH domain